jgi:hypothetical protein
MWWAYIRGGLIFGGAYIRGGGLIVGGLRYCRSFKDSYQDASGTGNNS